MKAPFSFHSFLPVFSRLSQRRWRIVGKKNSWHENKCSQQYNFVFIYLYFLTKCEMPFKS